ncbi:MAG TPA: CHRD domain-containing protein, partial [Caldimonas sp.]
MIARRFALATLLVSGALAVAGCGMMDRDKGMAGVMSVDLAGKNEVPPNASTGSGTARVELDGNTIKW